MHTFVFGAMKAQSEVVVDGDHLKDSDVLGWGVRRGAIVHFGRGFR